MNINATILEAVVPLLQTTLWIAAGIVIAMLFRREFSAFRDALVSRLQSGGQVKLGPVELGELRAEVNAVRVQVSALHDRVSQLFLLTMSPEMYVNLEKLASGRFGEYEMTGGLERELFHLRDMGYIKAPYIRQIPPRGQNLSEHVEITETGRQFVALRLEMNRPQ